MSRASKDAGGKLIVAPNFDADVVRAAKAAGLAALPGVMTPSEGFAALKAGADGLKLFPAEIIPPAVFKAWRAVFPAEVLLLAVGGVGVDNIATYAEAGASGYGIGSALYKPGRPAAEIGKLAKRAGCGRKGLIFRPFWPILSASRTEASRPAYVSRGRFIAFGAPQGANRHDEAEPRHAISGSPPIRGGAASRRAFRSTGARRRRASAGRWSAP